MNSYQNLTCISQNFAFICLGKEKMGAAQKCIENERIDENWWLVAFFRLRLAFLSPFSPFFFIYLV